MRTKLSVACLQMIATFKNETRSSFTPHFHIETLEKCSCEMVISGSLVQSYYSTIHGSIGQVASLAVFKGIDSAFWLRHGL